MFLTESEHFLRLVASLHVFILRLGHLALSKVLHGLYEYCL